MSPERKNRSGQSTTETILFLPFFLVMVFGLLQMGQLATALIVSNYAASSIAHQAVRDNTINDGAANEKLESLMTAGMRNGKVSMTMEDQNIPFRNVKVDACAEVRAFPFVGQFFGRILASSLGPGTSSTCTSLSTFAFNNSIPASFVIHGKATARMNYKPI